MTYDVACETETISLNSTATFNLPLNPVLKQQRAVFHIILVNDVSLSMVDRCNDCLVESEFACLCLINDLILIYANYQVVPKCLVSFPFDALPCKE